MDIINLGKKIVVVVGKKVVQNQKIKIVLLYLKEKKNLLRTQKEKIKIKDIMLLIKIVKKTIQLTGILIM